jgi:hypothetical protein
VNSQASPIPSQEQPQPSRAMAIAQSASSQRRGLGRAASTADATRRLGALRADVGTATPRARVETSQVKFKIKFHVKFEFKTSMNCMR